MLIRWLLIFGILLCASATLRAQQKDRDKPKLADRPSQVRGDEITPKQQRAVERGLDWLAARQSPDGSYGAQGMGKNPAVTSLAGLAFMQAGNLPGRGKYGENVRRCLDYVLTCCQESGLITSDTSPSGPMYGHGFATLFLAEVYGMTGDER
jgi:hypothetical protein